jgi:hypothetical protein
MPAIMGSPCGQGYIMPLPYARPAPRPEVEASELGRCYLLQVHDQGATKTMTTPARTTKISESILEELWFGEDDAHAITAQAAASFAAALADLEGLRPFSEVARRVLDQVNPRISKSAACKKSSNKIRR